MIPAQNDRAAVESPFGSLSSRKALAPELRSIRLTWTWQPDPAELAKGFDMKVAR
jgi:hypothetical protein